MATAVSVVADITGPAATTDLRQHQFKAVQITGAGVVLALSTNVNSGAVYVLQNKPNSGQACTLRIPPSVSKAVAGGAITRGAWVTLGTSADFIQGSYSQIGTFHIVGTAHEAPTAAGELFALQLR